MFIKFSLILVIIFVLWVFKKIVLHSIAEHQMKSKGYLIKYTGAGQISAYEGKDGVFRITYQEGSKKIVSFEGKIIGNKEILDLDIPVGDGYGPLDPQGYSRDLMVGRIKEFTKKNKIILEEQMRNQIIRKWLLEGLIYEGHLNVEERAMLGAQVVKMSEIKQILDEHFKSEKLFPVVKKSNKGFLHDGYIIEKIGENRYVLHLGQYGPWGDYRGSGPVGEPGTFNDVIKAFFEGQKDIDGIKIVREK